MMRTARRPTSPFAAQRIDPAYAARVDAFHPGPAPTYAPPARPELTKAEQTLLSTAVDRFADRSGRMGDLARRVIVLRATLNEGNDNG